MAAVGIAALLDGGALDKIDSPSDDACELVLHIDEVEQGHVGARLERDQHIDITIWSEVIAQRRAEQLDLADLPPGGRRH